tara:strand:- start:175 stop:531 length:357 start_codon:yes stop_codon:yes gene_type:complete
MKKAIKVLKVNLKTAKEQVRVADSKQDRIHALGIVKGYEYAIRDLENAIGLELYHANKYKKMTDDNVMQAYEIYKKYEFANTTTECDFYWDAFNSYSKEIREAAKELRKTYEVENNIF